MSWIHHQMLFFPPLRCSARPLCQFPLVASCLLSFLPSILSSLTEKHAILSESWLGHWRLSHFFALTNSRIVFPVYFGSLSICTVEHYLINFVPWFTGRHSCSCCNIAYTMFEKIYVVCFWWDVPFHLKTFVFSPENWADKAFFKMYFEAKSAIILSSFIQIWLVFQYTNGLNEILLRWLPSGVILLNFI